MSLVVKDNHVSFMGTDYFTGNAQQVRVGTWGEKKTPVFGMNKIEPGGHLLASKLKGRLQMKGPFTFDSASVSKTEFDKAVSATFKVIGIEIGHSALYEELKRQHLKFVNVFVEREPMRHALNESPNALDTLARYGNDARVVHSTLVVMEASLATSVAGAANFDVSADAAGILSVKASGGTTVKGRDTLTLPPRTAFGYVLLKLDWNKKKDHVDGVDVDEWSFS